MSDAALRDRAKRAGLAPDWIDAAGREQHVCDDTLAAVLEALGPEEAQTHEDSREELQSRCWTTDDAAPGRRLTALAVQLYSLRGSQGFGDLRALKDFARHAAGFGIDAIAVSPAHAPRMASLSASPYAPSSRLFLNPLYADVNLAGTAATPNGDDGELIDWPRAGRAKMDALRHAYRNFTDEGQLGTFVCQGGARLLDHARFEALDAYFCDRSIMRWRDWPVCYRDARGAAVEAFARAHAQEVRFHLFCQWLADRSLAQAHQSARARGMAIGLIADIAVGMSPDGSHAWSAPDETLNGLTIGAPSDIFNPQGQNWGLTALSPSGLRKGGFAGFVETLCAAMRHAGGVRIDHAMGLQRLWVIPEGADPGQGVYLQYPLRHLLARLCDQSRACRTIVIGEDLGTVPEGFRSALHSAGVLGMEVLWFQRDYHRSGKPFVAAQRWSKHAAALTTTHDLPTLAGWWCGRDIDWLERLQRASEHGDFRAERRVRGEDRTKLWSVIGAGVAQPPGDEPQAAVPAALDFVARTPCPLAVVAVEDVLGLVEQPNIPGTVDEHPNWRRRLPSGDIFASDIVRRNLEMLRRGRR